MLTVTKVFNFCYGHKLPDYEGKCRNYHGHNSRVEAEFAAAPLAGSYPGMIVDFSILKREVGAIVDQLDHKDLNEYLPLQTFFATNAIDPQTQKHFSPRLVIPTAEVICQFLVSEIIDLLPDLHLVRLRVSETDDSWAEWKE